MKSKWPAVVEIYNGRPSTALLSGTFKISSLLILIKPRVNTPTVLALPANPTPNNWLAPVATASALVWFQVPSVCKKNNSLPAGLSSAPGEYLNTSPPPWSLDIWFSNVVVW